MPRLDTGYVRRILRETNYGIYPPTRQQRLKRGGLMTVEYLEGLTVQELKSAFDSFLDDGQINSPAARERVWNTFLERIRQDCSVVVVDQEGLAQLRLNSLSILKSRGALKSPKANIPQA